MAIIERLVILSVLLSGWVESAIDESATSRLIAGFDDVGAEETTVDTSILMR
jgi:hypothetical protein